MCILILKPAGTPSIAEEHLFNCYKQNHDGVGFAFIDPTKKGHKRLRVNKGYFDFKTFFRSYRHWENLLGKKSPILLHFRFSTRGLKNKANCHPFMFRAGHALGHNGVLDLPKVDKDPDWPNWGLPHEHESDTAFWSRRWFRQWTIDDMRKGKPREDTERMVGRCNKLVLMDWRAQYHIINADAGSAHWWHGIWWSNRDYESSYSQGRQSYSDMTPSGRACNGWTTQPVKVKPEPNTLPPVKQEGYPPGYGYGYGDGDCYRGCRRTYFPTTSLPPPTVIEGDKKEVIASLRERLQQRHQNKTVRDKYICAKCGKGLESDLVGRSTWCWVCDTAFEKLHGWSNYEEQYYEAKVRDGRPLGEIEQAHYSVILKAREQIDKAAPIDPAKTAVSLPPITVQSIAAAANNGMGTAAVELKPEAGTDCMPDAVI